MPPLNRRRVTSRPTNKVGRQPTIRLTNTNPTILNVLINMKNNAKSEAWIRFVDKALTHLSQNVDLNDPEQVKQFIANKNVSNSYKKGLCVAYAKYAQYYQIQWNVPRYKPLPKRVKIPTSEKLEMLIAHAGRILSLKLQISKETGLRPVELCNLKVKDADLEHNLIYPTTAKHGAPRIVKISNKLTTSLANYISKNNLSPNEKLFNGNSDYFGATFRMARNKLAKKLNDPTIKTIRLYDFRHYFATTLYAKTRDILYVMQQMGHTQIKTTMVYTQLLSINDDEWTCKTAQTVQQATELIENGFEYVTEMDGLKLFRKRK